MSVLRDGNGNSINSSNPLPAAGKGIARTSNPTAFSSGSAADILLTSVGGQVTKQYSIPELDWS